MARQHRRSAPFLIEGILNLLIAIVVFLWPGAALVALVYLIAFWALFTGGALIAAGMALIRLSGEWLLVVSGAVSLLLLLATVLGTGMSSRLFTEVRERRGLAYYVFGISHSYTDAGSLYSQAGVDINRADEAVEVIAHELSRIAEEPVGSAELEKSRNLAKGRFLLQLENPQGMIMFGLRREVLEGEAVDPQAVQEGLDAVTAEDIQRVAQDVIGGHGLNLALIGPFDDAEKFEGLLAN